MTLREKIARALCRARHVRLGGANAALALKIGPEAFEAQVVDPEFHKYAAEADAVLALLSDPANYTDEMVDAIGTVDRGQGESWRRYHRRILAAAFTAAKESGQ